MGPAWRSNYLRYKRFFLTFFDRYQDRQDLRMFLEILLSLATISLFSLLALRPTLITIAELIKEIESKKETVAVMEAKIENLSQAQAIYDQEINTIRLLETSIPKNPAPDGFIRQVEGLAYKDSVVVLAMSTAEITLVGKDAKEIEQTLDGRVIGTGGEVTFSARVAADYRELFSFLSDMDKMRRPMDIDSLALNISKTEQGVLLVFVVNGRIPYMKSNFETQSP
jgi:hypothetical protein